MASKYNLFISYSSKDKKYVSMLANDLQSRGLRVWFDQWEMHPVLILPVPEFGKITINTYDDSSNKEPAKVINCDGFGKPINQMVFCLDKKGNLIRKDGKPLTLKPVGIRIKSTIKKFYRGFSKSILYSTRRIFYCSECSQATGIKNCFFIY